MPVSVSASDNLTPIPLVRLESITCSDGCDGSTDIVDAALGTDDRAISLRAVRSGDGQGRLYVLRFSATDEAGIQTAATASFSVPHDQRSPNR